MAVQPDGRLRLFKNIALDNRYEHTLWFSTKDEQTEYFLNIEATEFGNMSYQRATRGSVKVQAKYVSVYNATYMMFQNLAYGSRWFYAFVTSVEYVNDNTAIITYELDVMQTWMCNYTLMPCFIERQHTAKDGVGDNLVNEDIYFGPYVYESRVIPTTSGGLTMDDLSFVLMYNPGVFNLVSKIDSVSDFIYEGNVYSNVYQGVNFFICPMTANNASLIKDVVSAIDFFESGGFISATVMPTMFLPSVKSGYNKYNTGVPFEVPRNTAFGWYTPKNNKLFTYPYTCVNLTSHRNEGNDYAFEWFNDSTKATFTAQGNLAANPSAIAYATGYKGVTSFLEGAVSISAYPMCTIGINGFQDWLNNHLFQTTFDMATTAITTAVSPAVGLRPQSSGALGAINGVVGGARSVLEPGTVYGNAHGDIVFGNGYGTTLSARVKRITPEYARIVDEYFTKFGYAVNRVTTPVIWNRRSFNYIKTKGCTIKGYLPAADIAKICSIYDNGITFWLYKDSIGDYTQTNTPI